MPPAEIRFRGVSLYVKEDGGLTVLMPKSSGPITKDCRKKSKHFPMATLFSSTDESARPLAVFHFARKDLVINAGNEVNPLILTGLLDLQKMADDSNVDVKVARKTTGLGHLGATVRVTGGRASAATRSEVDFDSYGHDDTRPMLEVVWTAPNNAPVAIHSSEDIPELLILVQPGQGAVIGHFDDPDDALSWKLRGRVCVDDGEGRLKDVDFDYLYDLLKYHNGPRHVPIGPEPVAIPKRGSAQEGPATPLTSTCFGGCFGCT